MPAFSPRPTGGRRKALKPQERDFSTPVAVEAPADLTPAQRAAWDRLAPSALRMQTLTPETAHGFRLLVETVCQRDAAWAVLDVEGLTIADAKGAPVAHPLAVHARQLGQRVEALLSRFALVAGGRAVERPRQDEAATPSKWKGVLPTTHDFYGPLAVVSSRRSRRRG
jgi:hypothetical protein